MLKFFRKKFIAKAIFWALVILILPAFVLWGTGSISRSKEKGPAYVGIIDERKVSFEELFENITEVTVLIILNYFDKPQALNEFLKNKPLLAKLAWYRLIMLEEAKKYKIKISDKDVIDYIRSHPIFLKDAKFDDGLYRYVLRYNMGLEPRDFEEIIRRNLEIKKLNEVITKDMTTDEEKVKKADEWFRDVSIKAALNIDLKEIEKYYR